MRLSRSILAVAASTGRVTFVYLMDGALRRWGQSRLAARTPRDAKRVVSRWIDELEPDLLISEDPRAAKLKGSHIRRLLDAIAGQFEAADGLNMVLPRRQDFNNKYDEAKALV